MRVRARVATREQCPPEIGMHLQVPSLISEGKEYDVHAMSVFQGKLFLQIIYDEESHFPTWAPGWIFDVVDSSLPSDWICTLLTGAVQMVVGPFFLAKDEESYGEMIELHPGQVKNFWDRIEAIKADRRHDGLIAEVTDPYEH